MPERRTSNPLNGNILEKQVRNGRLITDFDILNCQPYQPEEQPIGVTNIAEDAVARIFHPGWQPEAVTLRRGQITTLDLVFHNPNAPIITKRRFLRPNIHTLRLIDTLRDNTTNPVSNNLGGFPCYINPERDTLRWQLGSITPRSFNYYDRNTSSIKGQDPWRVILQVQILDLIRSYQLASKVKQELFAQGREGYQWDLRETSRQLKTLPPHLERLGEGAQRDELEMDLKKAGDLKGASSIFLATRFSDEMLAQQLAECARRLHIVEALPDPFVSQNS